MKCNECKNNKIENKNWYQNKTLISIVLIMLSLFMTNALANSNQELLTDQYAFASIIKSVFPFVDNQNTITMLNGSMSTISAITITYFLFFLSSLAIVTLSLMTALALAETSVESSLGKYGSKALLLLSLLALLNFNTTVNMGNGNTMKIPVLQYHIIKLSYGLILDVERSIERISSEEDRDYLIPSIKVGDPLALVDDFETFTLDFLASSFLSKDYTLNVVAKDDLYYLSVKMGNSLSYYTFRKNTVLNDYGKELEIDIESKEKEIVIDYFNALVNSAIQTKTIADSKTILEIKNTEDNVTNSNEFSNRTFFDKEYVEYCESIDNTFDKYDTIYKSELLLYVKVKAMCSSRNFMIKHYDNSLYDYESVLNGSVLNDSSTMIFGSEEELTVKEIKDLTEKLCSKDGYFSCAPALQFYKNKYHYQNIKLGILSIPSKLLNDYHESLSNYSNDLFRMRKIDKSYINSNLFNDNERGGEVIDTITFTATPKTYHKTIENYIDLIDLSKLAIPSTDQVITEIVGMEVTGIVKRFSNCLDSPETISNGYRCLSINKEATDFGKGLAKTALLLKMSSAYNSAQTDKGLKGKLQDSLFAFLTVEFSNNYFTDTPYFSTKTINNIVVTQIVLKHLSIDVSKILTKISSVFLTSAIMTISLVFLIFVPTIFSILNSFKRLILNIIYLPMTIFTNVMSSVNRVDGEMYKIAFKEIFSDFIRLLLYIVLIYIIYLNIDIILMITFDNIKAMILSMEQSFFDFSFHLLSFVIKIVIMFFIINSVKSKLSQQIDEHLNLAVR